MIYKYVLKTERMNSNKIDPDDLWKSFKENYPCPEVIDSMIEYAKMNDNEMLSMMSIRCDPWHPSFNDGWICIRIMIKDDGMAMVAKLIKETT